MRAEREADGALAVAGLRRDGHERAPRAERYARDPLVVGADDMAAHAHANDGDDVVRLVSVWSHHPANEFLGGFEHIADATDWRPS